MNESMCRVQRGSFVYYTCRRIPVRHAFTTKFGGVSTGACESLNLGFNRGDELENVRENYRLLGEALGVDETRMTLTKQIHDTRCKPDFERSHPRRSDLAHRPCGKAVPL